MTGSVRLCGFEAKKIGDFRPISRCFAGQTYRGASGGLSEINTRQTNIGGESLGKASKNIPRYCDNHSLTKTKKIEWKVTNPRQKEQSIGFEGPRELEF